MADEPEVPDIQVVDAKTGEPVDQSVLDEHDVAYDPGKMHLDLTKDEKRRTTAIMLACQAYKELIIKDADYLRAAADLALRGNGPQIKPATMDAMVEAAMKFDCFIRTGGMLRFEGPPTTGGEKTETPADEPGDQE